MHAGYRLRAAEARDLASLNAIERRAARLFAGHGLSERVMEQTSTRAELEGALAEGGLWVVVGAGDAPVGFAHATDVDGALHLEELDVDPDHGRRGLGTALVEHVCETARRRGLSHVTLTTWAHVPWNAPFYERLGFRVLAEGEFGPGLRRLREHEARDGLDPARRVAMRRRVSRVPEALRWMAAAWLLVVVMLSALASSKPLMLSSYTAALPWRDKGAHFLLMGVLAAFAVLALAGRPLAGRRVPAWAVLAAVGLLVLAEEGIQQWLPLRNFSWADLASSLAGVAALGGAAAAWRALAERRAAGDR